MDFGNIIFATSCWLCALIFAVIALWAFKRKDPMHFWAGSRVRPEEISDIPSYNRANSLMWSIFAVLMVVTGIVALFSIRIATILLAIICILGVIVLIFVYKWIYNKYKNTSFTDISEDSKSKTPKVVIIAIVSISVIILISLVLLFTFSEKDPDVRILDDHIQISAMYGLNIDFSEITEISLIEKSISDIGIVTRTNGYSGFGRALKGNFESDLLGKILLFVQSKSSPTIRIERINNKDIYISLSNSQSTERLYRELIAQFPQN